ncbi:LysM peptidoglycan-binding domain-containing protein [Paenibacillus sp. HWE-109]|uniref:LysM peptidoglycan-binding domain-containing protein n=1 Tax=Paenibacillus sp. HWE-109 TaxID=1306526 RepID=UPI001EDF388D|nr:LysM peptidoglycan-binding domain-containing protein [Paenibacillus sp. HWE-109]UKS27747.1 LysM peptidoglycan-binding domain-containing protein [Paenibacillus sp. HWE-109]
MKIHIVKKGDSLYELATKYHTTLDQIIALNPQLADPNHLDIGMKVKIPSKPSHIAPPEEYAYKHVVAQGDSLWKLGKAWDVPLQAMIQANPQLKNPNVLMTGEIVYVPKANHQHHQGQEHAEIKPINSAKPSTMPFEEMPNLQPWPSVDTSGQQAAPPVAQMPEPAIVPAPEVEEAPVAEQPIAAAPIASVPVIPQPEPGVTGLESPYEQAVHPFHQFHIKATEVFAQPANEQPEAATYPAFSSYQQAPWEQHPYGGMPQANLASEEGCGCGGPSMMEQPWSAYPAGYPTGSVGMPWDGYQQGLPTIPGLYPPLASPYDMHHAQASHNPYGYAEDPYGIPFAGAHYQAPYEAPMMPQVHTHELAKEKDTEEVVEIDIRSEKPAKSKSSRSTKKVRLSGNSALNAFLRRQQRAVDRQEQDSKPVGPWINY